MLVSFKLLDVSGDTIVEVMVVLAVLGLAIGISFATANRSLLDTSQAEENSQATAYAQSEVEDLRYLAPTSSSTNSGQNPTTNIFNPSGAFCIVTPTAVAPIITATANNCRFGTTPYVVVIYNCDHYIGAASDCNTINQTSDTFVVQATWPDLLGEGTDSATLSYRVHSP